MSLLVATLWPGLLGGALLGLAAGTLAGLPCTRTQRWAVTALALPFAALCTLAVTGQVPGRAGLWVETGALVLGTYLAGCLAGGVGRRLRTGA